MKIITFIITLVLLHVTVAEKESLDNLKSIIKSTFHDEMDKLFNKLKNQDTLS